MPRSMTSFARREVQHPWGTLSCEIRSVNHRYLEASVRLPETLRAIEPNIREVLRKQLSRGKVETNVYLRTETSEHTDLALNQGLADKIVNLAEELQQQLKNPAQLNPLDILRWPGVLTTAEVDSDTLQEAALAIVHSTLEQLLESREREGKELKQFIEQRLEGVAQHVRFVHGRLPEILESHRQKLREKLDALKLEVDEERFSQEAVYVAQKADVAEELDRLEAHINEVRHTLQQKGPIGRRLDFLMQELNREANTLSSKSMASDTTQSAVDLKVLIEQMREQVQNIE
ncbi:hypothetical protein TDB9533_04524 [Thalassocella blandensis]|nr:hypothetical protein TDB9533_04524 [Thalassocella blandensis]